MQDLHKGWGEGLAGEMADRKLTKKALADAVEVHPSTIGRILEGTLNPNDELKWKIAGALHKRMDELWAWPRVIPPSPQPQQVAS